MNSSRAIAAEMSTAIVAHQIRFLFSGPLERAIRNDLMSTATWMIQRTGAHQMKTVITPPMDKNINFGWV